RADIMQALQWGGVLHYGTQNASRIGLFATRANLEVLSQDRGAAFEHTWRIGNSLCDGLRRLFDKKRVSAIVQNVGPMLQIMFTDRPAIRNYREYCAHVDRARYQRFALNLLEYGVYMSPSATLHSVASLAHSDEDVALTLDAVDRVLENVEA
ncbi:MAG: hypothetical protein JSU86_02685, partial [Phycisphaerales bacterium]